MEAGTSLWVKGSGSTGCLLNHSLEDQKDFVPFSTGFKLNQLALSGSFILATDIEGNLWAWGTIANDIVIKPVQLGKKVGRISCGWNHGIFQSEMCLMGFGCNSSLQLGVQSGNNFTRDPVVVWEGKVDHLICGFRQSYIIANNSLFGCGQSKKYELGISQKKPLKWRQICCDLKGKIGAQVYQLSIAKRFLLMRTKEGNIWAIGCNQQNCFNQQEISHSIVPTLIFQNIQDVATGWAHIILLNHHGNIQTFGRNNLNQLGRQQAGEFKFDLGQEETIIKVVSGTEFGFMVTTRGRLLGWGWNQHLNISNCGSWSLGNPKHIVMPRPVVRVWTHPAITVVQCEQS